MNETLMQPSPKLRKSHSAYDCTPEREVSLLSSSIKSTTAKRASQHSDAGSINTTLLVCKSASTHNLSLDTNLLLPEPTRFQKSLSVIERNDHRSVTPCRSIENVSLPKAAPAEKPQLTVDVDIKKQTSSALLSESFDKAEVCPWEVPEELPANKNQKHVTYSLSNQDEPKSPGAISSPTLLYVCPWEYLPPPSPPATETGNGIQSDVDSTKPKPPISCSAPGSPHTVSGKPKDFRVFSFHSATHSLLAAKGIGELGRSMSKEKSQQESNVKEGILQKSLSTSMRLSPGSATSDKRTPQTHRRAMTTVGTKPSLVKQTAIRLPSTDSPEKSPKHIAPVHICPWESEEVILEVKKQNVNDSVLQRQCSDKQVLSMTVNNDGFQATDLQLKSLLSVPNPEVCPWDVPKPFHQSSISEVCPWEVVEVEQLQTKSINTDVCPCETDCDPSRITKYNTTVEIPTSGDTQKQVNVKPEACPSSVKDTNISQVRQGSIQTHSDTIKPGERVIYVNARQSPVHQEPSQRDACSIETSETLRQEESDFPEPPPPVTDISPWQSEPNTKDTKRPSLKETMPKKATVCPWEVEDSEKLEERGCATNKESMKVDQEQETVKIIVCPWETSESVKSIEKEESVCGDVCPWETSETLKNLLKPQSVLENVCPWETGESTKTLQKQESIHADVCPTKILQKQDVCPWQTGESVNTLQKQESVHADVCPWETKDPTKALQKQESAHEDVCPWETGEPTKTLQKQDSVLADVCPWETAEPVKTLQKQERVYSDVCQREAKGSPRQSVPQDCTHAVQSKRQDSTQGSVYTLENDMGMTAATTESSKSQTAPDIHPSDLDTQATEEMRVNPPLARRDAMCPWEMEGGRQESITVHDNSDVFTWEEAIPEEDDGDAETAAEAFIFPSDL